MKGISALLTCLALGWSAQAGTYCSLKVRVVSPEGKSIAGVPISIREPNGRTIENASADGDTQFCDLGLAPVKVTVGADSCGMLVIIQEVPVWWEEPYRLVVTYDPGPCVTERGLPSVRLCEVLVRVSDEKDNWISGSTVLLRAPKSESAETDGAGRVRFLLALSTRAGGSVTKAGYHAAQLRPITCSPTQMNQEQRVVLKRN